jgi:hypothetical protein
MRQDKIAGLALISAAAATIFAMGHHPHGLQTPMLGRIVHGALILFLLINTFGLTIFARQQGAARSPVLAGLLCLALAAFGHVGAATINGFVMPALAARDGTGRDVFLLAWEANQALATLGVVATSAAISLWSVDLLSRPCPMRWTVGGFGLAAGIVPPALLLTGLITMNVTGAFICYGVQAAWSVLLGVRLLRGAENGAPQVL